MMDLDSGFVQSVQRYRIGFFIAVSGGEGQTMSSFRQDERTACGTIGHRRDVR